MMMTLYKVISILSLMITVATVLFMPPEWLRNQVATETNYIEEQLGSAYVVFEEDMTIIYESVIVETGVYNLIQKLYSGFEVGFIKNIGKNIEYEIFQMIQRLVVIWYWLPYCLLLMFVAFADGLGVRSIKQHTFGFHDTKLFHLALHVLIVGILCLFVYLNYPIGLENPVWIPLMIMCLMAASVHLMVSNYQKVS